MAELPQWDRRQNALGTIHAVPDDLLCRILCLLSARDVGTLACVSSVFNILCNEEPLWMQLCLEGHKGDLDYKGSWKQTVLAKFPLTKDVGSRSKPSRQFQGFSSLFLYRRWYRCHVGLEGFALDNGAVERRNGVLSAEFATSYDANKPVLLTDLMEEWPARKSWSNLDQLVRKCGDAKFEVSQPYGKSVTMNLKDFANYMDVQHDEEPLYIFDAEFGESVPELLNDYQVPSLFSEDLFSVLKHSERHPFRWLVLGPARSGASWHVDPLLTSAWNALLSGRKRWALYPPGRVPPGVTLNVNEDDGSFHYDGPTSLQWWLDVYPHLDERDKPLECTQRSGETIYVPSGWWHCVLNIDASIAVTQNYVNINNFEVVCMDMAPGYRHRAIARAGMTGLDGQILSKGSKSGHAAGDLAIPIFASVQDHDLKLAKQIKGDRGVTSPNLLLALEYVRRALNKNQDGVFEPDQERAWEGAMVRKWLRNLWVARPEDQHTIWKGACLALDAETWLHRVNVICQTLGFTRPADKDQLPIEDGSNPVYFVKDYVIKLYTADGPAASIDRLGSELNFYSVLRENNSEFQKVVPKIIGSGILFVDGEEYLAVPWDGRGDCSLVDAKGSVSGNKRFRDSVKVGTGRFRTKWSESVSSPKKNEGNDPLSQVAELWPYLVTERCGGVVLSEVRKHMTDSDHLSLATFLGKQLRFLHTLSLPKLERISQDYNVISGAFPTDSISGKPQRHLDSKRTKFAFEASVRGDITAAADQGDITAQRTGIDKSGSNAVPTAVDSPHSEVPKMWKLFVSFLRRQRQTVSERFHDWRSLPDHLLNQIETYIPKDPAILVGDVQVLKGMTSISGNPVWLHMDIMADNIVVDDPNGVVPKPDEKTGHQSPANGKMPGSSSVIQSQYILDYGGVLHGDPLYDLLAIHLDVFQSDGNLLDCFLKSYQLPFSSPQNAGVRHCKGVNGADTHFRHRLSYCAMCYCLLHELDIVSAIFSAREDLRTAMTFEEIEHKIWGSLNEYIPQHT